MAVQMLIRVDYELKEKLTRFARNEGKSTNQMVREIIEDYIKDRDIEPYIDDLWKRIGKKLKSKGLRQKDIVKKIKDTRQTGK